MINGAAHHNIYIKELRIILNLEFPLVLKSYIYI